MFFSLVFFFINSRLSKLRKWKLQMPGDNLLSNSMILGLGFHFPREFSTSLWTDSQLGNQEHISCNMLRIQHKKFITIYFLFFSLFFDEQNSFNCNFQFEKSFSKFSLLIFQLKTIINSFLSVISNLYVLFCYEI